MDKNAITVTHLLQVQRDLSEIIRAEVSGAKQELRADIASSRTEMREELAQVKAKQDIANGRTTKLEGALARLRVRVDRGTSLVGSMSKGQKAKLAAAVAVVVPMLAEAFHRLAPIVLTWVLNTTAAAAGVPPPQPPAEQHAPAPDPKTQP